MRPMKYRALTMMLTLLVGGLVIGCSSEPEARFTPSPIVGKDVERLLAEIDIHTDVDGKSFGPYAPRGSCVDCDLRGAKLAQANMSWFDLSGANLSGTDLYYANFWGANLSGANLSGANLKYTSFMHANLYKANLDNVFDAEYAGAKMVPEKYR